jgi:acyl carrier protein
MLNSDQVKEIIAQVIVGYDVSNLFDESDFQESGIDSLDHMNVMLAIEEKHGIQISDDQFEKCNSILGIISCVNELKNNKS